MRARVLIVAVLALGSSFIVRRALAPEVFRWQRTATAPNGVVVVESKGPAHCGLQRARFLSWDELAPQGAFFQYARGFERTGLRKRATTAFSDKIGLPRDAAFSGFKDGGRELWFTPERAAAYVVRGDHVERWPQLVPPMTCQ